MTSLFILSLAFGVLTVLGESSKCDKKITDLIRDRYWNFGKNIPKDISKTGAEMSPAAVVRSTEGYFQEDAPCFVVNYCGSFGNVCKKLEDCFCPKGFKVPKEFEGTEENGTLSYKDKEVSYYFLYTNKQGVSAVYRCYATGSSGRNEGFIYVSGHGHDEKAVAEAVKDLAFLDIKVSNKVYDMSCLSK